MKTGTMGFESANYTGERLTCSLLTDFNMHMLTATFSVVKTRRISQSSWIIPGSPMTYWEWDGLPLVMRTYLNGECGG